KDDPTKEIAVPPDVETLRKARQSLEAIRAAGVEWLPRIAKPTTVAAASHPVAEERQAGSPPPHTENETSTMPRDMFDIDNEPAATPEQRRVELSTLAEVVSKCMRCSELCSTRTQTVFGVGPLDPLVCFVGEAPGADEDKQGEPFVGAAGQLLNKIIEACGFQ